MAAAEAFTIQKGDLGKLDVQEGSEHQVSIVEFVNGKEQLPKDDQDGQNMPVLFSTASSFELDVPDQYIYRADIRKDIFTFVAYEIGGDRFFVAPATDDLLASVSVNQELKKFRLVIDTRFYNVLVNPSKIFTKDNNISTIVDSNGVYNLVHTNFGLMYNEPDRLLRAMSNSTLKNKFKRIEQEIADAEIEQEKSVLIKGQNGRYIQRNDLEKIEKELGKELFNQLILGPAKK